MFLPLGLQAGEVLSWSWQASCQTFEVEQQLLHNTKLPQRKEPLCGSSGVERLMLHNTRLLTLSLCEGPSQAEHPLRNIQHLQQKEKKAKRKNYGRAHLSPYVFVKVLVKQSTLYITFNPFSKKKHKRKKLLQ